MKLFGKDQRPGDPVERTPAELFEAADAKREDLAARLEAARVQRADLADGVDKERAAYRAALAHGEIEGTVGPSRELLTRLEGELAIATDRVAGLEAAVAEFEPQWRTAKRDLLTAQAGEQRAAAAVIQEQIHVSRAEQQTAEQRTSDLHLELQHTLDEAEALERQARELHG